MDSDAARVLVDRHLSALLADLARQPADQAIPALHAGVARLQAALVQRLGSFQAGDGPQHDGCKTLRSWTRLHLRESPAGAGRLATAVSTLGELPGVAAAFSGGEISLAHVAAFGTGLMDRKRLEPGKNAYVAFVTLPKMIPDLAYRYVFDRASFYRQRPQ